MYKNKDVKYVTLLLHYVLDAVVTCSYPAKKESSVKMHF